MKPRDDSMTAQSERRFLDRRAGAVRAFTLIELLTVMVIISVLLGLGGLAFRRVTDGNVLAQSRNMVVTYAKIARSYAVANRIETMMVVNPFNGRFELWRLNPPVLGGPFDPLSATSQDGYTFAPVFDSGARLPVNGNGVPMAAVHPIDYDEPVDPAMPLGPTFRPATADANDRNIDNLTWAAFCFDENGRLVIRTRRIATRTFTKRDGIQRPSVERNRLIDESPDLTKAPLVNGGSPDATQFDTAITSTRGFVITDAQRLRLFAPLFNEDPAVLVQALLETRPNSRLSIFSTTVLLNRFTGQELVGGAP